VIAGPLLGMWGPGTVSAGSLVMALALSPVVLAVAEAARGEASDGTLPGRLWPGLAAIAGLLLVLAEPSLSSPVGDMVLVLEPVMVGCGAALFCSGQATGVRVPLGLLGAAGLLAVPALLRVGVGAQGGVRLAGVAAAMDALQAGLSLMALDRLSGARWSAQFALVPLIVLVEGMVLLRTGVPARVLCGIALLGVASVALLAPPAEEPQLAIGGAETGGLDPTKTR
jgi:hypothetical protein